MPKAYGKKDLMRDMSAVVIATIPAAAAAASAAVAASSSEPRCTKQAIRQLDGAVSLA